jgi:hypothetical protein
MMGGVGMALAKRRRRSHVASSGAHRGWSKPHRVPLCGARGTCHHIMTGHSPGADYPYLGVLDPEIGTLVEPFAWEKSHGHS